MRLFLSIALSASALSLTTAFVVPTTSTSLTTLSHPCHCHGPPRLGLVRLTVDLPPTGSERTATMKIEPCLSVPSEMIEVRYKVPFDLNVAPQKNLAVCTKDGPGGEKVGDVLRFTSQWSLGLPQGDGLVTTAAAFSGRFGTGVEWIVMGESCHGDEESINQSNSLPLTYLSCTLLLVLPYTGGGLRWGCSMFDVLQAKDWGQVVEALVSNTQDKTDEVVLIFERPLEEAPELK